MKYSKKLVDPRCKINDLRTSDKIPETCHKSQVRLIGLHIIISVLLAFEFDHESMSKSVLDKTSVSIICIL